MLHKTLLFLFLLASSSCTTMNSLGSWQQVKSIDDSTPVERHEAAFVKVGSKFYLLGGRGIRAGLPTCASSTSKGSSASELASNDEWLLRVLAGDELDQQHLRRR